MRILLVGSRFPWPPWRGNQLRTVQWLDALDDRERMLICPAGNGAVPATGTGVELRTVPSGRLGAIVGLAAAAVTGRPAQEGIYGSAAARRTVAETVAGWRPDVAVVQMVRCGWAADEIRRTAPGLPLVFDAIDCMALHFERAAASAPAVRRPFYFVEAGRCLRREAELVRTAAVTTAVSARDLAALGASATGRVVPVTGGQEAGGGGPESRAPVILLSGNLGYGPTVRAAHRFAGRVWPRLRERLPAASWVLAGARPARSIRCLAALPGVEVFGDVDDLGVFLGRARVAIAPMASGSGVPIKILEAMAAGVPVVADPWSAAGLEDPGAVVVADDDSGWVEALHRLLVDGPAAAEQATRGREVWRTHYSPARIRAAVRAAVDAAVVPPAHRGGPGTV